MPTATPGVETMDVFSLYGLFASIDEGSLACSRLGGESELTFLLHVAAGTAAPGAQSDRAPSSD